MTSSVVVMKAQGTLLGLTKPNQTVIAKNVNVFL
jgi:hypothetical protein